MTDLTSDLRPLANLLLPPSASTSTIRSPRLTWSDTSSKSARPAKDFESCETASIAESAQCSLGRCLTQLLSHEQTSLYAKIDIFFPADGQGDYVAPSSFHQTMYRTITKTPD